jgi:hypothetical protein
VRKIGRNWRRESRSDRIAFVLAMAVVAFIVFGAIIAVLLIFLGYVENAGNVLNAELDIIIAIVSGILGYMAGAAAHEPPPSDDVVEEEPPSEDEES